MVTNGVEDCVREGDMENEGKASEEARLEVQAESSESRRDFIRRVSKYLALTLGFGSIGALARLEDLGAADEAKTREKILRALEGKYSQHEIAEFMKEFDSAKAATEDRSCHCTCSCTCQCTCDSPCACTCTCVCSADCSCNECSVCNCECVRCNCPIPDPFGPDRYGDRNDQINGMRLQQIVNQADTTYESSQVSSIADGKGSQWETNNNEHGRDIRTTSTETELEFVIQENLLTDFAFNHEGSYGKGAGGEDDGKGSSEGKKRKQGIWKYLRSR